MYLCKINRDMKRNEDKGNENNKDKYYRIMMKRETDKFSNTTRKVS